MNKKVKKVIIFLFIMVLVFGITGCNNDTSNVVSNNEDKNNTIVEENVENINSEGLPIVKEMETFQIYCMQVSSLVETKDKPCVIKTEDETNVHIEWIEVPKSNWKEKVNILFSTSSLPDAFVGNIGVETKYHQLMPLDEYLTEDIAPNVCKLFEERPEYKKILTAPDGHIYSLPGGDEEIKNLVDSQIWINTDWLVAVRKDMPTTTDEFYEVLKAFKDGDPNGNGDTTDEIPFTFRNVWGWSSGMENVFGPFGVVENDAHVFVVDNKVTFSAKEDGYYEALVYLNKLYSEGLIDAEAFTQSNDEYNAKDGGKNILGVHINWGAGGCGIGTEQANESFKPLPILVGPNGDQYTSLNNIERKEGFEITTNCENPEVLVRWYDYINSNIDNVLSWGRGVQDEGWETVKDANGNYTEINQILTTDDLNELGYESQTEYRAATSFGGQSPTLFTKDINSLWVANDVGFRKDKEEFILNAIDDDLALCGLPYGYGEIENIERRAILLADIDNYLNKFIASSIMNGIDENLWEEHLKALDDLQVEEYINLCQEYVDGLL